MEKTPIIPVLSESLLKRIASDGKRCADTVHLRYVHDKEPGIERKASKNGFIYLDSGMRLRDPVVLERIRKIVIPPAWTNVWICRDADGHIQATGLDKRGRKQYKYHPLWIELRNRTKFSRLLSFGEKLPLLRLQIEKDLAKRSLCEQKVLATVISLMERTYIRVGNQEYEKIYGSYGLTTLKDEHVQIRGGKLEFSFRGKKGISHKITLHHKKLARIVKQCREIPGEELFQYYDEKGERHTIDSGKVNQYIQQLTGEDFTAKDFRTWAGSLNAIQAFRTTEPGSSPSARKRKILDVLDYVSMKLGNTRTVCKKYYIHPVIFELYETEQLGRYLKELDRIEMDDDLTGWTSEEIILMKILRRHAKKKRPAEPVLRNQVRRAA